MKTAVFISVASVSLEKPLSTKHKTLYSYVPYLGAIPRFTAERHGYPRFSRYRDGDFLTPQRAAFLDRNRLRPSVLSMHPVYDQDSEAETIEWLFAVEEPPP